MLVIVCSLASHIPISPTLHVLPKFSDMARLSTFSLLIHDLVKYSYSPLTVQAEHTHAGGAIQDGVACREGPYAVRRICLAGRRSVGEHADSPLFVHPLLVFVVHFWVIQ